MRARTLLNAAILAAFVVVGADGAAWANILILIDKASQRMSVTVDGVNRYNWPVSTGRPGYATPSGTFTPFRMEEEHFSQEWDDAPMPYSIFFTRQGHAIHGSYHSGLGTPRSHGCVRISPTNAAILYSLVQAEELGRTKVVLTGGGFGFGFSRETMGNVPLPPVAMERCRRRVAMRLRIGLPTERWLDGADGAVTPAVGSSPTHTSAGMTSHRRADMSRVC